MSKNKKRIRAQFKEEVFKRDNYKCVMCGHSVLVDLDAHHITDRNEIPNGGYVKENGITLCNKNTNNQSCHMKAELYHISEGVKWNNGFHPDDLYNKINSSKNLAIKKSILND